MAGLALLLACTAASRAAEVSLASGEWLPYESRSLDGYGPVSRVVSEALALAGYSARFSFLPWGRALHDTRRGLYDATFVWSLDPARKADFYPSAPVFTEQVALFFRRAAPPRGRRPSDLSGILLGGTANYHYCPEIEEEERRGTLRIERVRAEEMSFAMLAAGRLDAVMSDRATGRAIAARLPGGDGIVDDPRPLCELPMHMLVSRTTGRGREIVARFDAALARLKASGRFDRIMEGPRPGTPPG